MMPATTRQSTPGVGTLLSFGAKSVQPEILEKMLIGRYKTADLLEKYVREIALNGQNHQVFMVGPRGSGKTHLLRVLYHRVADLVQSRAVVVAYFAEEEYGISGYFDFLVRILNAFIWWYDADKIQLETQLNVLRETHPNRQESVAERIISDYVGQAPLLILSENFDDVSEALGQPGQAQLRAWLYRHNRISIIATAQAISPDLGREDRPFYGFFSPIYLKKLSYEDSLALLTALAETEKNPVMLAHLAGKGKAQVRAIHELVKGNHRLLVTFYEFLKADTLADLSVIFMKTMNDLKPYYESFIRYLPPQQQKILHYLALATTPRQGTDIGKDCFIPTTSLTKQLSELQRRHLIEPLTNPADRRTKLYDVAEPLLRVAIEIGEQREGIAGLFIDFLALYYSHDEIKSQKSRFENLYLSVAEPLQKQKLYYEMEARDRALKLQNELLIDQMKLIEEYVEQNNYEQVIRALQKSITIVPDSEELWNSLSMACFIVEDSSQAIEAGLKAIELNADPKPIWLVLGLSYVRQSDYVNAIKMYEKIAANDADSADTWGILGDLYNNQGDYYQALKAYNKVVETNLNSDIGWYALGTIYYHKANYVQATYALKKAVIIKPDFQEAWSLLGICYDSQTDYINALHSFQKVVEISPTNGKLFESLEGAISEYLANQYLAESELIELKAWLQDRPGFEIITTYVGIYRRVVFGKEEKALYDLPKEQRAFFVREILRQTAD